MAAPIQSSVKCEVRSIIRFLNATGERPADIHKRIVAVYDNVMNRQNVAKWWNKFSEGRSDVHDGQTSSRPSLISDDFLQETEEETRANRRVTIRELHHIILEVPKTTIHEAVAEKLGYRKLCARWVTKMLTDDHKMKRMGSALKFLTRCAKEGDEFLDSIVTGAKLGGFTTLLNPNNSQCNCPIRIPPRTKNSKLQFQCKKIMSSVSCDRKSVLLVDFMHPGATINAAAYGDTLIRLRRAIQNKWGECCHAACAFSMTTRDPILRTSSLLF